MFAKLTTELLLSILESSHTLTLRSKTMSFKPEDIMEIVEAIKAWVEAIKALIALLKELFPDDKAAQVKAAKMVLGITDNA